MRLVLVPVDGALELERVAAPGELAVEHRVFVLAKADRHAERFLEADRASCRKNR